MRLLPTLLAAIPLASASSVYLHPAPPAHRAQLLGASALLAHHLGLDRFEPAPANGQVNFDGGFVGEGESAGVVVTVEEKYIKDVIPTTLPAALTLRYTHFDPSNLLKSLTARASHIYSTLTSSEPSYTTAFPASVDAFAAHFDAEEFLSTLAPLVAFLEEDGSDKFGVFELKGLSKLTGEMRDMAVQTARATIESAMARKDLKLVVLSAPSFAPPSAESKFGKRAETSPSVAAFPQIVSDAICYATDDACVSATGGCSGHGSCAAGSRAGKTCYVCQCSASRDEGGRTTHWAGNACEREDVSSQFVLLAGTTIGLLAFFSAAVGLLVGMGSDELPGVLTGGAAPVKRD
ncbi:unnamed protein product [Peniophora sp. CBMAI 1063]|nr:unnamed protein product [Peniophora sp. CBMAI 1063]